MLPQLTTDKILSIEERVKIWESSLSDTQFYFVLALSFNLCFANVLLNSVQLATLSAEKEKSNT